jgi:hypothetical protein
MSDEDKTFWKCAVLVAVVLLAVVFLAMWL